MDKWECIRGGYIYDPAVGDEDGGIKPGIMDWIFQIIFSNSVDCQEG